MSDTNAINAMLAHQSRAGDDNSFVRSVVESYTLIGFGTVKKYEDERVDVVCGNTNFTNVEVAVLGVDGWGVKVVPAENDRVLLFSSQVPVSSLKEFTADGSMPAYDRSGLKAIPITDSSSAQLITVDKDGIVVTGDNQLTVNADGVHFEDVNGNVVDTTENGIHVQDLNENVIDMTAEGFSLTDANGNTFVGDSSNGIVINGNLQIKPSGGAA